MTMNNIFSKLRKQNKGNYRQLIFCITFAILLVTSFGATVFSPTIQNALDDGGDSRKLVAMIFVIAVIGCLMFSVYAAGLFFKYKSQETGVFLALGTPKKVLSKALYTEVLRIILQCTIVGILLGFVVSFGVWQIFRQLFMDSQHLRYEFSLLGAATGLLFAVVIGLFILILAMRFMKRSNLMDILNDERKREPMGEITKGYGLSGIILLVVGVVLGYIVPVITGNVFHYLMPGIWNAVYLLALVGLYRIITYAISSNHRGRNPQKYYKKLVSSSMMKFQGKQTVRNMLVIALLVAASLFALSYVPMNGFSLLWKNADKPTDFSLIYKLSMDEVAEQDITALATKHGEEIASYDELIFSELIRSGVYRDFDENETFLEDYHEKLAFSEFISASAYNEAMNTSVSVSAGKYILLLQPDVIERIWVKFNDLDLVTNPETGETMALSLAETLVSPSLALLNHQRYILNDGDYAAITAGILPEHQTKQILFNVADYKKSYPFAKELFGLFMEKAPPELARSTYYDEYQHSLAVEEGRDYSYATPVELSLDNANLMGSWRYYPTMKIIVEKTFFQEYAVQFLLFIYVAIICLAAVAIIAYTRSLSVGLSNRQVFDDLEKLGANNKYITKIVTSQLNKIFVIPVVLGSALILVFGLMLSVGNDGQFTNAELKVFGINLLFTLAVWVYLYVIYRFSLKKVKNIVGVK